MDGDPRNDINSACETCNNVQKDLLIAKHSRDICNKCIISISLRITTVTLTTYLLAAKIAQKPYQSSIVHSSPSIFY